VIYFQFWAIGFVMKFVIHVGFSKNWYVK